MGTPEFEASATKIEFITSVHGFPRYKTHLRPFTPQLGMLHLIPLFFIRYLLSLTNPFPCKKCFLRKTRPRKTPFNFSDSILTRHAEMKRIPVK
jgi:hypothetical protein